MANCWRLVEEKIIDFTKYEKIIFRFCIYSFTENVILFYKIISLKVIYDVLLFCISLEHIIPIA